MPSRLALLGIALFVVGCASEPHNYEHQTRVPMLPTGARVLVHNGVKMYEYQGVLYHQMVNGNGWEVVPSWQQTTTTKTTVSRDGKTVIRD